MHSTQGTLFIIPTPIGNLQDLTPRALETLQKVDLVVAEDTRHSGLLLNHFGIKQSFLSLHDHNEQQKTQLIISKLQQGTNIGLVSDAGTPLISDPGFHLVRECRDAGIKIVPLAGACAAIVALSGAGIASDRFCFEGFLSAKSKGRQDRLQELSLEPRTMIFYESTHRILQTLEDMQLIWGKERYVVLARELTKTWETITGETLENLIPWLQADPNRTKGEMVIIAEGYKFLSPQEEIPKQAQKAVKLLAKELPLKTATQIVAELFNLKKNALYQWAINLKNN